MAITEDTLGAGAKQITEYNSLTYETFTSQTPQLDYFVFCSITDVIQSYVVENGVFRRVENRNKAYKILARRALEKISLVTLRERMKDL